MKSALKNPPFNRPHRLPIIGLTYQHQGSRLREFSSLDASGNKLDAKADPPKGPSLKAVPTLPFVGSLIPQYSGIPRNFLEPYFFWSDLRKKFGDFYTIGFPGFGRSDDIYHRTYVLTDPNEMMKVVRSFGPYPNGLTENLWPVKKWMKGRDMTVVGMLGRGEEWKRLRTFFQTDLLHPESARGYVPAVIQAAQLASKGAPASSDDMNVYFAKCSFDMFCSLAIGDFTQVSDKAKSKDPLNKKFVETTLRAMQRNSIQMLSPYETFMDKVLNIETKNFREMATEMDSMREICKVKVDSFIQRKEEGTLSESEKASYLYRALERQKEAGSNVSFKEAQELLYIGFFAAVDTTSSVIGWNMLHIARLPEVQEKLYRELKASVELHSDGVSLNPIVIQKSNVPYLHAVIRETQRLTPAGPLSIFNKTIRTDDVVLHGVPLQQGEVVAFDNYSLCIDPTVVEDAAEFIPERWLPDAVEARKGTPQEIMDHPYFREPFSQGARKCPASRVALNEIQVMVAQLVLDWKMSVPIKSWLEVEHHQLSTVEAKLPTFKFELRS